MTVYRIIKSGELPAVRVGRSFRVRDVDVDTYLGAATRKPADARARPPVLRAGMCGEGRRLRGA